MGKVRLRLVSLAACAAVGAIAAFGAAGAEAATTTTATFSVPGTSLFTVPAGVSSLTIEAIGAAGGAPSFPSFPTGGQGASVTATVSVTPGEVLFVGVGGPGQNGVSNSTAVGGVGGGGSGGEGSTAGGGGGGASLVGVASAPGFGSLPLVVAGGGGGGGGDSSGGSAGAAGFPRSACGFSGEACGGGAGTQSAGGGGGSAGANSNTFTAGSPGASGTGGNGGIGTISGGGGGGGLFGGGGGGGGAQPGASGGGGSSFVTFGASVLSAPTPTSAPAEVAITYPVPTADQSTGSLAFGTQPQGTASASQPLTVTNNGLAPLIVSGVLLGGANPGDYLINDGCQQPVAPGATCQIAVLFEPHAVGQSTATLTLVTNAVGAAAPVSLSGSGVALPVGATGSNGPTGTTGTGGTTGTTGTTGTGGAGAVAPSGQVELLTCKPVTATVGPHHRRVTHQQCAAKLVSGTVAFNDTGAGVVHATLTRGAVVFARGIVAGGGAGAQTLVLTPARATPAGRYTLTLRQRVRGRSVTRSVAIVLR